MYDAFTLIDGIVPILKMLVLGNETCIDVMTWSVQDHFVSISPYR